MKKSVLLCLHGWGGSGESFDELRTTLRGADIEILTPDLPGFGSESEPEKPWTVDDFAQWIENLLSQLSTINYQLSVVGHSLGGRIAIKLATRGNLKIEHLYLCAAAGIKRPRHIKRLAGLTIAKCGSAVLSIPGLKFLAPASKKILYKLMRVHDYEHASPIMQKTLVKITREDLRPLLKKIKVPTDIFWGEDDQMTPLKDAHVMHREIEGSSLHTYEGVRHRVHRDKADEIASVILRTMNVTSG